MTMNEVELIEDKVVKVSYRTIWYIITVLCVLFISGIKFYSNVMESQARIYAKLDTIDRRDEIKRIMQTNINRDNDKYQTKQDNINSQLELRLQRVEARVGP